MKGDAALMLRGRRSECERLDRLLQAARDGESGALVVRGEPGVGKSALLQYVVERAAGCRVERAAGVQSEMELPFAGLHQLCGSMLDRRQHLPGPQRDALGTAFGLCAGTAPDRFFVGLAVLGLLALAAEDQPLVCVVDDAQWLDRASAHALAFGARRLSAEGVAVVFAVRTDSDASQLTGLPELVVEGLRARDARALLDSALRGPLDEQVRDRIVAETRGNPLALLELPRGMSSAELAGGFGLPDSLPLSGRIEDTFRRRLAPLPDTTRRLLLIAAAEPIGEPLLVWRAAQLLGIDVEAAAPSAEAGLCEFGSRMRFRHPLVRSAVYRAASLRERQRVHWALAEATDPESDPDRRAWHRAQAAPGPDEEVAMDLERSAGRAQARGGLAAAAAFLERATRLTVEPDRRALRALAAAQAKLQAGAPDAALESAGRRRSGTARRARACPGGVAPRQVAFAVNRGRDAPPLLLKAARRLESLDVGLARETYLDALWAALFVGRLADDGGLVAVAQAVRAAPPAPQAPSAADLLLDGLALLITEGYEAATTVLKRALRAFRGESISREEEIRWLHFAGRTAVDLWDDETWEVLAIRHVEIARDAGALSELAIVLSTRIGVHLNTGEFAAAAALVEEAEAVAEATGNHLAPYGALWLAAWRGREAEVFELIEATMSEVVARGEGVGLTVIQWAKALLYNALGRYEDALVAAEEASAHPEELGFSKLALPELIEAAARSGQPERARDALKRLSESTRASGTDWALGIEARCRALLADGEAADDLYREAIDRLDRTRVRVALAGAHLLYGEWLRRRRRRADARVQLRAAHELFSDIGAEAFAERARRELLATGATARKRAVESSDQLTARETQIARLARTGLSNPEIGARLFISPRTVQYHLHKVFAKLDITSRTELEHVLPGERHPAQPV